MSADNKNEDLHPALNLLIRNRVLWLYLRIGDLNKLAQTCHRFKKAYAHSIYLSTPHRVRPECLEKVLTSCPALQVIKLNHVESPHIILPEMLKGLSKLRVLSLQNTFSLTSNEPSLALCISAIHSCENLQVLDLSFNALVNLQPLADALSHFRGLRVLNLNETKRIDSKFIPLVKGLAEHCPNLQELYLKNSGITDAHLNALSEDLHRLERLEILDLAHNEIHSSRYTGKALARALSEHPSLRKVYLSTNMMMKIIPWMNATRRYILAISLS